MLAIPLLLLGQSVRNGDPNTTGTVPGGEAEHVVGTPVAGDLVENDILHDFLHIGGSNTLAKPISLHLSVHVNDWANKRSGKSGLTLVVGTAQTL